MSRKASLSGVMLLDVKKALETVYTVTDKGELDSLLQSAGSDLRKRFGR